MSEERRQSFDQHTQHRYWWKPLELAFWITGVIESKAQGLYAHLYIYQYIHVNTYIYICIYVHVYLELFCYKPEVVQSSILHMGQVFGDVSSLPILRCRAILTAKELANVITERYPNDVRHLLMLSAQAMLATEPLLVRLSACRAFTTFLTLCQSEVNAFSV